MTYGVADVWRRQALANFDRTLLVLDLLTERGLDNWAIRKGVWWAAEYLDWVRHDAQSTLKRRYKDVVASHQVP